MAQQSRINMPLTLEDMTAGLLYYYGVIKWDALYGQLRDCFHIELDERKAWKYMQEQFHSNPSLPFRCQNRLFIYNNVKNPKDILKEQENRPGVHWRPVTEAETRLLAQGQDEKLWGEPERRLLYWIQAHKNNNQQAAVRILSDYIDGMRNDAHIQDIISSLSYDFPLESFEEVQEVISLVNQVWNHIPQWQLKGWTSRQVFEQHEKSSLRPLPPDSFPFNGQKAEYDWLKVGRNDPCPCGSHKKFKKCCLLKIEAGEYPDIQQTPEDIRNTPLSGFNLSSIMDNKPQTKQEEGEKAAFPAPKKGRRSDPRYTETLASLLNLFMEFIDLQPWHWMDDSHLFALRLQEITCYVSVFGAGGDLFGLAIYPGDEGLQYYLSMEQSALFGIEEIFDLEEMGPSLLLVLGDRKELTSQELRIYKESPYRFYGRGDWPVFRSYQQGLWPWKLNLEELELAVAILSETIGIAEYHRLNWRKIERRSEKGEIPCYLPGVLKPDKWLDLPPFINGVKQWRLQDIDLQRVRKIKKYSAAWEMDWFYLPIAIEQGNRQAPYLPIATILVDLDFQGLAMEPQLCARSDWDPAQILSANIVQQGLKPRKLLVRSTPKAYSLELLSEQIGFELVVKDELQMDELREALLSSLD